MNENNQLTQQQSMQHTRLQTWAMSLICALLVLCVMAAATRIPHYLAMSDYIRLIAVILFAWSCSWALLPIYIHTFAYGE